MLAPFLLIFIAFAADRLSKQWVAVNLADTGFKQIHPFLSLHVTYNRGIAFGMWQGIGTIVGWISILVVLGLFIYMIRLPRSMILLRSGLAMIIGGALGNLVDRVTVGQVLDFIQTPIRPGVFNVADVMIYLGVFLSLVSLVFRRHDDDGLEEGGAGVEERINL